MKTGTVKINGEEYTLALTLDAFIAIQDKIGGIDKINDLFVGKDLATIYKNTVWLLSVLLSGGCDRAALINNKEERRFTVKELGVLCEIKDLAYYRACMLETIIHGMNREVEVENDSKNAETM